MSKKSEKKHGFTRDQLVSVFREWDGDYVTQDELGQDEWAGQCADYIIEMLEKPAQSEE